MTNTTTKLLNELNAALGLKYPDIGYAMYQDVVGNGIAKPRIYVIVNAGGGVTFSELNDASAIKRCANIRAAIAGAAKKLAIRKLTDDLVDSCKKLDNDFYGNPRYYFPAYMFPQGMTDKSRSKHALSKYRGKRYGAGFVMQSYSIKDDTRRLVETILSDLEA